MHEYTRKWFQQRPSTIDAGNTQRDGGIRVQCIISTRTELLFAWDCHEKTLPKGEKGIPRKGKRQWDPLLLLAYTTPLVLYGEKEREAIDRLSLCAFTTSEKYKKKRRGPWRNLPENKGNKKKPWWIDRLQQRKRKRDASVGGSITMSAARSLSVWRCWQLNRKRRSWAFVLLVADK